MLLFGYLLLIWCPVRFWPLDLSWDSTWVFALNYAAANGLQNGKDIFWTTGPLGPFVFPMDLGENLGRALIFQECLWAVIAGVLVDGILLPRFPLRNTVAFAVLAGLSAPLYWFNYVGLDYLLFGAVVMLLTVYRRHGGWPRLGAALVLAGLIPLIKLTGGVIAAVTMAGFTLDYLIRKRAGALWLAGMAGLVPLLTSLAGFGVLTGGPPTVDWLRVSGELSRGYSLAMSTEGDSFQLYSGAFAILLVLGALWLQWREDYEGAKFLMLVFSAPVWIAAKHGFVRAGETQTPNFYCFVALVMGYLALSFRATLRGQTGIALIIATFGWLWFSNVERRLATVPPMLMVSGLRPAAMAAMAVRGVPYVREQLQEASADAYRQLRVERELRQIIGNSEVSILSVSYNWAGFDGLALRLFPVVQRYAAFTPVLDEMNALWVAKSGPRFLLFDGSSIDGRNPLAETPAMFLEVLRWYDVKAIGARNLLLERRGAERFRGLERILEAEQGAAAAIRLPRGERLVLLSRDCELSASGRVANFLLKVPAVMMTSRSGSREDRARVIPETLRTPAIVSAAPRNVREIAALFDGGYQAAGAAVDELQFDGPGLRHYEDTCRTALYRPSQEP